MKYEIQVNVMPLEALLDPQGRAVQQTMHQAGYSNVERVRIGRHIVVQVEAEDENEARVQANEFCTKLLSNPIMEGFEFTIVPL